MIGNSENEKLNLIAKIAGLLVLFNFFGPFFNWFFFLSKLSVSENIIKNADHFATAENLANNQNLLRGGIAFEIVIVVCIMILTVLLYSILKKVNEKAALAALSFRMAELVLMTVFIFTAYVSLQIINAKGGALLSEEMKFITGLLYNAHIVGPSTVGMIFSGIGAALFFYLLAESGYVPAAFAWFGVISYVLLFIHGFANILFPDFATMKLVQAVFYTPSCVSEISMGTWLLVKGLKFDKVGNNG